MKHTVRSISASRRAKQFVLL